MSKSMNCGTMRWNWEEGEGRISLSNEFQAASWVLRADALVDWKRAIEEEYDKLFTPEGQRGLVPEPPATPAQVPSPPKSRRRSKSTGDRTP